MYEDEFEISLQIWEMFIPMSFFLFSRDNSVAVEMVGRNLFDNDVRDWLVDSKYTIIFAFQMRTRLHTDYTHLSKTNKW